MKLSPARIRMLHIHVSKQRMARMVEEARKERQRQATIERSITAELMGDPLPGRSALDRKQCDAG